MATVERRRSMHRLLAALVLILAVTGCREVRVKSYTSGTTPVLGPPQLVVIRDANVLQHFGIKAPVRFTKEFGVL